MFGKLWREMHQSWLVVAGCVGIIIGMVLGLVLRINYFASWWWVGFAVALLIVAYLKPKIAFVVIAGLAGMVLAFFRVSVELGGQNYINGLVGAEVLVEGEIEGDPETDEDGTKYRISHLKFGEEKIEASGKLYVKMNKNEELAREDTVVLSGKLLDGFGIYAGYLYKPRVMYWVRPEPGAIVLTVRNWFAGRVEENIPEAEAKLGLSYLLGMKTGLSDELAENLRVVGLTHIVVASGAHLSILVELVRKVFGRLSRMAGVVFAVVIVVVFMSMVGWTPSIVRAGTMAIMTLVAGFSGRAFAPWRIILLVMAGTLMANPMNAVDLGWLLSFASYIGIMMVGPRLTKFLYGAKKPGFVGSMVITTVAATLMTLPIVLYYYGTVSLISVVANLLILPTLPWAMGLVFLTGVLTGVPGLEMAVGWCATKMLEFHILVVEWLGGMRQFLVEIPPYQWQIYLIYGAIILPLAIGWIWRKRKKVVELREVE